LVVESYIGIGCSVTCHPVFFLRWGNAGDGVISVYLHRHPTRLRWWRGGVDADSVVMSGEILGTTPSGTVLKRHHLQKKSIRIFAAPCLSVLAYVAWRARTHTTSTIDHRRSGEGDDDTKPAMDLGEPANVFMEFFLWFCAFKKWGLRTWYARPQQRR